LSRGAAVCRIHEMCGHQWFRTFHGRPNRRVQQQSVAGRLSMMAMAAKSSSSNQRRVIKYNAGGGAGEENIKKMYARAACGMCFSCTL